MHSPVVHTSTSGVLAWWRHGSGCRGSPEPPADRCGINESRTSRNMQDESPGVGTQPAAAEGLSATGSDSQTRSLSDDTVLWTKGYLGHIHSALITTVSPPWRTETVVRSDRMRAITLVSTPVEGDVDEKLVDAVADPMPLCICGQLLWMNATSGTDIGRRGLAGTEVDTGQRQRIAG